jgi:hypothetical protein
MEIEVKDQELKTARYSLQITGVDFWHDYLKEDENNAPIKCNFKSTFEMEVGGEKITKEVSNTVFINPEEPIYKEILLHSKHIVIV